MSANDSPTDTTPPTHAKTEQPCGYCDEAIGLMPLAGASTFYCSLSCLIFAEDYPPETEVDAEGGES